jgi:short-subunit dehydrogenase
VNASKPVALITGASSGIGEAFSRKLAGRGCHLILVARRIDRLKNLAAELDDAEALKADLTAASDLRIVEHRIIAEPQVDFLVNNAGFGFLGSFFDSDLGAQDRMHRLHILAQERLTHAALMGMVKRGKGNIINVSSVAGFLSIPYSVSYGATKAWINSFTEGLFVELKSIGSPVRVQALCPGFTRTEFHDIAGMDRNVIPRSLWMTADEVVDASLRGLERNRVIVVPGWRYRLFLGLYRWFPRSLKHLIAIRYGSSRQRNHSS